MKFDDLTEEQKAKVLACKTPDDLLELAKAEGYDLSDEELDEINGGEKSLDGTIPTGAVTIPAKPICTIT